MPATSLGITYPCVTDDIGTTDWSSFANTTDAALVASITLANGALLPNYVMLGQSSQTIAAGASTAAIFDVETYDRGNMFNPGTPTIVTLPANGSYQVAVRIGQTASPATITGWRVAVLVNAVEFAYHKEQNAVGNNVSQNWGLSVLLPARTAGQQITVNHLYTGTGNMGIQTQLQVVQVANV